MVFKVSRSWVQVSAAKVLQETCSHIRRLHREVDDLSERLSELLDSADLNSAQAAFIRSLLMWFHPRLFTTLVVLISESLIDVLKALLDLSRTYVWSNSSFLWFQEFSCSSWSWLIARALIDTMRYKCTCRSASSIRELHCQIGMRNANWPFHWSVGQEHG